MSIALVQFLAGTPQRNRGIRYFFTQAPTWSTAWELSVCYIPLAAQEGCNTFFEETKIFTFGKQTERFKTIQDGHKVMLVLQRLIFLILSFHNSRIRWVIFGMFRSHGRIWEGKLVQTRKQILLMNLVCVNETFSKMNSKICITLHILGKTKRMPEVENT